MRTSKLLLATVKETPADAELASHQLMIRAGMIRKLASGLYTWLPLGFKVLKKVEAIVREEMDKSGAQEMLMSNIQPKELWEQSGRWDVFGPQLLKMEDRHGRDFCFGPTHEEVITDFVKRDLKSYKQLPATFYQIQTKFRDEIRPRFGVMRAREFLMKDAYSFDVDVDGMEKSYALMHQAYSNIFTRLHLTFRCVLADTGAIGGSASQEFHVLADSGEDEIFYSDGSDYAANVEFATALIPESDEAPKDMGLADTPGIQTVPEQAKFMNIPESSIIKTLLVKGAEHECVALLISGDDELNEIKAQNHPLVDVPLQKIDEVQFEAIAGCKPGFVGPKDLNVPVVCDPKVAAMVNFSCGANQDDKHYVNLNWDRDLPKPSEIFDLRTVKEGDLSPDGQGQLKMCRGIEVGHIFQLGDKYSQSMQALILNEQGKAQTMQMGCYGIGVSRIVAAAIEQNHDDRGIIWPETIAPFKIALVPMNYHKSHRVQEAIDELYAQMVEAGMDVLLDDRKERPGVLFADLDLIGIPHRIVLGEKGLDAGVCEYKARNQEEKVDVKLDDILSFIQSKLA